MKCAAYLLIFCLAVPGYAAEVRSKIQAVSASDFSKAPSEAARTYLATLRSVFERIENLQLKSSYYKQVVDVERVPWSLFLMTSAQAADCSAKATLGFETCVFAGSLSNFISSQRSDGKCSFYCAPPKENGICGKTQVQCNPLLFLKADGSPICAPKTGSPTKYCNENSDPEKVAYVLQQKINADPKVRVAWDQMQKGLIDHCTKNMNWSEQGTDGACYIVAAAASNIQKSLDNSATNKASLQASEKTVCLFEVNGSKQKITLKTVGKDAYEVKRYVYQSPQYGSPGGWMAMDEIKGGLSFKKGSCLSGVNCSDPSKAVIEYANADNLAHSLPGCPETKKYTFQSSGKAPSTCKIGGFPDGSTHQLPFDEISKVDSKFNQQIYLGEMDQILGRNDLDETGQRLGQALAFVKAKSNCGSVSIAEIKQDSAAKGNFSITFKRVRNGQVTDQIYSGSFKMPGSLPPYPVITQEELVTRFRTDNNARRPLDLFLQDVCSKGNADNYIAPASGSR